MQSASVQSSLARAYLKQVGRDVLPEGERPYNATRAMHVLRSVLREEGPLNGALRGPVRFALGLEEVRSSDDRFVQGDGVGQMTCGTLSTYGGIIGLGNQWGTAAQAVGLSHAAGALHGIGSALGGAVVGSTVGGAASSLKGVLDVVRGVRTHDHVRTVQGALKVGLGGMIVAGALAGVPALVAAGTAGYLLVRLWRNHKQMSTPELLAYGAVTAATAAASPLGIVAGSAVYAGVALVRNRKFIVEGARRAASAISSWVRGGHDGDPPTAAPLLPGPSPSPA